MFFCVDHAVPGEQGRVLSGACARLLMCQFSALLEYKVRVAASNFALIDIGTARQLHCFQEVMLLVYCILYQS